MEDLDKPFDVALEIKDAAIGNDVGGNLHVKLDVMPLLNQLPNMFNKGLSHRGDMGEEETPYPKRQSPMMLPQPHIFHLTYRVVVPPWYVAGLLPANSRQRFGPVTISQQYSVTAANAVARVSRSTPDRG